MSNDDLLKLLDLGGNEAPRAKEPLPIAAGEGGMKPAPASPTALRLDAWGLRRGADLLAESERLQESLAGVGGRGAQAHAAADFHGAAFEPDP